MYDHLLVPVSFEPERLAQEALDVAQALASDSADITLLHVMEAVPPYVAAQLSPDHVRAAQEQVDGLLRQMAEGVPGVKTDIVIGQPGRGILDYANDNGVDCIVIASHRPGIQDAFFGSTAAQVVRHAKCTVHVLR